MSNEITPPPNDEPEQRAPSEPATVKLERNRLEALTDWFVAGVLGWLLYSNTLHGEVERGAALTGLLAIAGVGGMLKALGKGGSATVAMLHFAGKPAVKLAAGIASAAARNTMQLAVIALLLGGCGADLSQVVQSARVPVNAMGRALERHHAVLVGLCANLPGGSPAPAECPELIESYNAIADGQNAMQDGLDALESAQ